MSSFSSPGGRLDFIQGLRGVAALMVVLGHAQWFFLGTPHQELAQWLLDPGGAGVDIFFVISGFVMVYSTRNSPGTFNYAQEFLIKRLLKIWTPYAVIGLSFYYYTHGEHTFNEQNLLHIAKSLLFIPPDASAPLYLGSGLLTVAWSLNYEFYFYIVFGISLIFKKWRWLFVAAWMFLFLYVIPVYDRGFFSTLPMSRVNSDNAYLQLVTNPIILEFLAGIIIGMIYLSPIRIKSLLVSRLFFAYAIAFCAWGWATHFRNVNSVNYYGIYACTLVLACAIASKTKDLHTPPMLVWLGSISYSLYLVHIPVNYIIKTTLENYGMASYSQSWGHVILTTATSIIVATASHKLLETLLHDKLSSFVFRHKRNNKIKHQSNAASIAQ